MTKTLCLDEKYSTTRLPTQGKLEIINNLEDKFETILFLSEGGLRTKGYFKKSYEDNPLISIITVVFNGEKYLEETIQSVINQTYENIEYIIIDGGSTDGTLDIIKKYEDRIDYWVSEKDNGIYDAMNKGIAVATGEWINFMNAGDKFINNSIVQQISPNLCNKEISIVFGDTTDDYGEFQKLHKANPNLKNLWKGMLFSHQSTFFSSSYHKQNLYDITYKLAADFSVIYNAYRKGEKFYYLNMPIAMIEIGGVSYLQRERVFLEYKSIVCRKRDIIKRSFFNFLLFKLKIKKFLKSILPTVLINMIIKYK